MHKITLCRHKFFKHFQHRQATGLGGGLEVAICDKKNMYQEEIEIILCYVASSTSVFDCNHLYAKRLKYRIEGIPVQLVPGQQLPVNLNRYNYLRVFW